MEAPPPRRYEFFISRAGADAAVAREVADVLRHAGHTVQYQDEDIPLGSNFIERMSALVEDCKNLVVILSPAYLDSPYCREEWTNFLADLFSDQSGRRVVVLLAQECKPPGILRARVFGSLAGKADPAARRETIMAAAEGRAARLKVAPSIFEGVPPRNPAFTGREDILARLDEAFAASGGEQGTEAAPVAIIGPGGVGKSTLVAEYLHRHAGDYWGVWWAPAESRSTLVASLADLAARMGVASADPSDAVYDVERRAKEALSRMRASPLPWLVVYDNAESPDAIRDLLPVANARALITSRWSDWLGIANEVFLEAFDPATASLYLLRRTGFDDEPGAGLLAETLGHLPLALDQAGAFCRRSGLSFDAFRSRAAELIRKRPAGSANPRSVFATFSMAIDAAAGISPHAERMMALFAFLSPDDITLDLFPLMIIDPVDRASALEGLGAVSLATVADGKRVIVHRLAQEVMRQRVGAAFPELRPVLHELLKHAFADLRPHQDSTFFDHVRWCLHYDPDPGAAINLFFDMNGEYEVEVECGKEKDGAILFDIRVTAHYGTLHTALRRYRLAAGWQSETLRSWNRN